MKISQIGIKNNKKRCAWVPLGNVVYEKYHDKEWGVPIKNDRKIFEFIILESAQAGLSWAIVLNKREGYRKAFLNFDPVKVSKFGKREVNKLLNDKNIIRNRQKIEAAINNAKVFLEIQKEFGTFSKYMWGFVNNKVLRGNIKKLSDYPHFSKESEAFAKDLKSRGFKFFGPTVAYAHMQAVGMINDHMLGCFRR